MPNRLLCDVLDEMRKMYETRNFSGFLGLVEEMQVLANRMEAGLQDKRDYRHWHDKAKKEKEEYKKLVEEGNKLRKKQGKPEKEVSSSRWD